MDQLIAEYLREAIEAGSITYRELAAQTGMSLNRIGIILRQEPPPATIGELSKLAHAVGLSAAELLARAELALMDPAPAPSSPVDITLPDRKIAFDLVANDTIDENPNDTDADYDNA